MVVHLDYEPPHLNLFLQEDFWISKIVTNNIQEALLRVDGETGRILPNLATEWKYSDDGLRLELTLRESVFFHDGRPFGGEDVEFTFRFLMDPDRSASSLRQNFAQVESFEARENSFVLKLKKPDFKLLQSLAHLPILPRHVYASSGLMKHNPADSMAVGTGPFKVQKWQRGESILLQRHDGYWGETAFLDEIFFRIIHDRPKAVNLLKKGELDMIPRVPVHTACDRGSPGSIKTESVRVMRYYPVQFHSIIMNVSTPQLRDARVRKALAKLTPRKLVAESLLCNHARPITGPYMPDRPGYDHSLPQIEYSPADARRLLEKAGWSAHDRDGVRRKGGKRLELTYLQIAESSLQKRLCPILKDGYRRAGVKLNIERVPFSRWLRLVRTGQFHMADVLWTFSGKQDLYQHYHCSQADTGSNYGSYCNPEADRLLEKIRRTLDSEKRHGLERRLHNVLYHDPPAIYLFNTAEISMARNNVRNSEPNHEGFPWRKMWLDVPFGSAR